MTMPSYRFPRRISRWINFSQSSTIQRMGRPSSPESLALSRAQETIPLEASTWTTSAPALEQAKVAPPV